jgi:hypothetical protein
MLYVNCNKDQMMQPLINQGMPKEGGRRKKDALLSRRLEKHAAMAAKSERTSTSVPECLVLVCSFTIVQFQSELSALCRPMTVLSLKSCAR